MRNASLRSAALLSALAFIACGGSGEDNTGPLALAGNYTATEWTTTGTSGITSELGAGSTLNITLNSDGSTSGHLHLAATSSHPAFDADMAGTWTQSGSTVDFNQSADTFVRDLPFAVVAQGPTWSLVGDGSFSGTAIHLTLTRT